MSMASLAIGSPCKPTLLHFSKVLKPGFFKFNKERSLRFQQRHCTYEMDERFYKRLTIHRRKTKKFELDAASTNDPGSDHATYYSKNPIETTLSFLGVLYRFTRPYAAGGTVIHAASICLLAVEKISDFSPMFFLRALQAIVGGLFMQVYVSGFNQICDVEIDKVNKPFLPLAAGELSMRTAILVSFVSAIMSLSIARIGSTPLFWGFVGWFIAGTAYSANLPLLRWKRFSFTTALCMLVARVLVVPVGYYMHIQNSIHGRSVLLSRSTLFSAGILSFFSFAIIFFKDIPDIEGDQMHGIKSLASRIGQTRMFWSCICVLQIAYVGAAFVGATSTVAWSKYVTTIGHLVMLSLLWMRAKSVDMKSKEAIQSMYMFIWQLFYSECFLIPLVR